MFCRIFPKAVFCLVVIGWASGVGFSAEDVDQVDLASLKMTNSRSAAAVRACVITEVVSDRFAGSPARQALARDRLTDALLVQAERSLQQAAEAGAAEPALARIEDRHAQRLASLDGALWVQQLNRAGAPRRRVSTIDFEGQRARHEDADLRDLDALVEECGLTHEERLALDKSGTLILRADGPGTRLLPLARLAIVGAAARFCAADERCKLGLMPPWVFESHYDVEVRVIDHGNGRRTQVLGFYEGKLAFHILLRPDRDYRVTQLTTFDLDGRVSEEFSATDYRKVAGIWLPFHTEARWARDGVTDYWTQSRTVQGVQVNPTIRERDGLFAVPATYRIQDMTAVPAASPRK